MFFTYAAGMKKFTFVIAVVLGALWAGDVRAEDNTIADLNCDITDEQTVYWAAMSQAVTLRTHIKSKGDYYPIGILKLILEDGTEIDLGQGLKYIDDAPEVERGDCNKHLEIAKADTLKSLSEAASFATLESLWAYSEMGQDCMDAVNLPEDGPSDECQTAASVHQDFTEASAESSMNFTQFKRLRESSAPLITVRRSTYYSETFVYDAQTNRLHKVLSQGC